MTRLATMLTMAAIAGMAGCSMAGTGPTKNGGETPMANHAQPDGTCQAAAASDDALIGKTEHEATALLNGCLWRISERDGKVLPGTMDYRQERRNLGLQNGKVIWVRRG
ncbi:hypothetical protein [Ralstonia soli]|uniref:Lipoprotein n=1 Tax=Ralstonia soli TaxID=2953896 RepID=A0ABT1ATB5_9RALS|nr:hypothetical protein [Ralstonia soli]MCO5401454.1 hypothetical protein [Ralstonia soli]